MSRRDFSLTGSGFPAKQRGAASVEAVFVFGFLVLFILSCSDLLSVLRLQQRLDNLAYNLTQMVSMTAFTPNTDADNPFTFYGRYAEQQVTALTDKQLSGSQYGLAIDWRNLATGEEVSVVKEGLCTEANDWPTLTRGIFVRVSLCLKTGEVASGSWLNEWLTGTNLRAGYVQEIQ
ncbi:tight adherence pilus pseudopilin TadF [Photobacterium sp. 2_MG-2023]|uniref:TadE/TadG family type IV pilus assembly protein n=1 Tax=Photobacterium sp. 2_MG-2023 TaxID=3062663 RepID=UPI0026E26E44|nr:tight adherence pilus pseudopilin TadF [Photobacterium sp. 2_MG-2023]MDO6582231.1 tight adherence pilus pseudopilin TadF [Photobacterium sp. 2_MG-2023]